MRADCVNSLGPFAMYEAFPRSVRMTSPFGPTVLF
jgi:hypothetical protein